MARQNVGGARGFILSPPTIFNELILRGTYYALSPIPQAR
jgi:hypothetical protein